uniref:Uncharacterized protein n=1 Tax=Hanusia phi TaxID=3032 RepID=A0A7S0EVC6_9CRYP
MDCSKSSKDEDEARLCLSSCKKDCVDVCKEDPEEEQDRSPQSSRGEDEDTLEAPSDRRGGGEEERGASASEDREDKEGGEAEEGGKRQRVRRSREVQREMDLPCLKQCLRPCRASCRSKAEEGGDVERCLEKCKEECSDKCYVDEAGDTPNAEGAHGGLTHAQLQFSGFLQQCTKPCTKKCVGSCQEKQGELNLPTLPVSGEQLRSLRVSERAIDIHLSCSRGCIPDCNKLCASRARNHVQAMSGVREEEDEGSRGSSMSSRMRVGGGRRGGESFVLPAAEEDSPFKSWIWQLGVGVIAGALLFTLATWTARRCRKTTRGGVRHTV